MTRGYPPKLPLFLWHIHGENIPQDQPDQGKKIALNWLVSGLNTNGDVESHPPQYDLVKKKSFTSNHAFWGVLNIRRKDPVNSATSWIDCGGFSSRFFCRNHLLYRHVVACLSLPKKHHLTQEFTNPVDTLKEHPKYLVSTTGSSPFSP